jgi:hypothetical protein
MRRVVIVSSVLLATLLVTASPAFACGGLIGPSGAVNLLKTATLAGYVDGVEHYVTAFKFAGGGGEFGSIVPLPDIPTKVERGGDWTLQRLVREVAPPISEFAAASADTALRSTAQVILETRIDALDLTVLKGGGDEVGIWAKDHGFRLPPDAPEVLDFYADRSPIFMAARFDADAARARGQSFGDGTPIHLTIPTDDPWVPLRILALGKQEAETVQADVFLLTDRRPRILPRETRGMTLARSERANELLVSDLRTDKGMEWVPQDGWLSYIQIDSAAGDLDYDLAVSVDGGLPSRIDAGMAIPQAVVASMPKTSYLTFGIGLLLMGLWFTAGRLAKSSSGASNA